ncbi:MAG: DNA mismatch repair protein MutS, partial [Ignavibacteriae bacterium]
MSTKETPLMRQYNQIKKKHPDTVLLFRLGDFYETFGDDAVTTAAACGITLTKRNNGAAGEIPLAGFPHHQLDSYLPKLVRAGHRVAVCEQLEDPKQAKGIVRRDVVEVVTPGVVLYDKLLDHKSHTYLACLTAPVGRTTTWGLAIADVSTGTFIAGDVDERRLPSVLESYNPSEILVSRGAKEQWERVLSAASVKPPITKLDDWHFDLEIASTSLLRHFRTTSLKGYGLDGQQAGIVAAGVILHYVGETQRGTLAQLTSIRSLQTADTMVLDAATRRNLEIHASMHAGERSGALVEILDRTTSPMGGRMLRWWLQAPLLHADDIRARHAVVRGLVAEPAMLAELRQLLGGVGDLERLMTKVVTDRANARDLAAIRHGLTILPMVIDLVRASPLNEIQDYGNEIGDHRGVCRELERMLSDEPPVAVGSGSMFREGIDAELDHARSALLNGKDWIREYQEQERARTGIATLKISFNNVFGYYIEISKLQSAKVPDGYERKQTLANAERYTTPRLKELEVTLLSAGSNVAEREAFLLSQLRAVVGGECQQIQATAHAVARLDCLCGFADAALTYDYVEPEIHEGSRLEIDGARHPVIERVLPPGTPYVANSIVLDAAAEQIHIITGPNMSGKSSYLRQTALIVFLAHVGSFVPATRASIPLTDRIFTRVGAQDNIVAGESTFLVEMAEAANILNNATERSLILLDELGRGTATFDGISIAWAIAEYLHETIRAKTLFATHYHELTGLSDRFERVRNYQVEVRDVGDHILFTHKVVPGHTDHSFGIHVAQMAGLPSAVVQT